MVAEERRKEEELGRTRIEAEGTQTLLKTVVESLQNLARGILRPRSPASAAAGDREEKVAQQNREAIGVEAVLQSQSFSPSKAQIRVASGSMDPPIDLTQEDVCTIIKHLKNRRSDATKRILKSVAEDQRATDAEHSSCVTEARHLPPTEVAKLLRAEMTEADQLEDGPLQQFIKETCASNARYSKTPERRSLFDAYCARHGIEV